MKTILGTAANHFSSYTDGGIEPSIEVIIMTTEPHYLADASGQIVRSRTVEQVRFVATSKSIRGLAEQLTKMAVESDSLHEDALDIIRGTEIKEG